MEPEKTSEWYEDWFDSSYYSILYKNRDDSEARMFIDNLLDKLRPPAEARILDLACGRGRFARHLAEKGYEVTGLDLSENSILQARQYESERLSFFTHDMRLPFRINYFDYIFNFFTSFGYFATDREHLRTLKSVRSGLRDNGVFVLDFFNARYVRKRLPAVEEKELEGIRFHISKKEEGGFVTKSIQFEDKGRHYHFKERVRLYECDEIESLFEDAGLNIVDCYGDYGLSTFDVEASPRLILVATS